MANSGTVVGFRKARDIEAMAASVRTHLGLPRGGRISLSPILEHMLDMIFEDGHFEVEEDRKMAGAEARTSQNEPKITVSASTYEALHRGQPRARMTIAHEIGHLLMHCQRPVAMNRSTHYDPRYDPEWQADMFAAALLMPAASFRKMRSIEEAMSTFGVSWTAANRRAVMLRHDLNQPQLPWKGKKATPKRRP